jgi:hypothetical protein
MISLDFLHNLASTVAVFKSMVHISIVEISISHKNFKPKENKSGNGYFNDRTLDFLSISNTAFFPGEGNQHTIAKGAMAVSRYIDDACKNFYNRLPYSANIKIKSPADMVLDKKENTNYILLGGPVANYLTRALCGYREYHVPITKDDGEMTTKILPVYEPESGFPFAFFCGLTSYGYFPKNGQMPIDITSHAGLEYLEVIRGNDNKEKMRKQLYGIVFADGRIDKLETKGDELAEDRFFVVRRPNPWIPGRDITIFSGVHGYSIRAFSEKYEDYLTSLMEQIPDRYFMAMFEARFTDRTLSKVEIVMPKKIFVKPIDFDKVRQWDEKMKKEGRL